MLANFETSEATKRYEAMGCYFQSSQAIGVGPQINVLKKSGEFYTLIRVPLVIAEII